MAQQFSGRIQRVFLAALLGIVLIFQSTAPAGAVTVTGKAVGYAKGAAWIGSYRLADGTLAFCLQAGKASPVGSDFALVDGRTLGWFSEQDSARLAYISREWAHSDDPLTAAAGQLATWTIGGLNGRDQSYYAARAGDDAAQVLTRANEMLTIADREASLGISAELRITLPDEGSPSIRADLLPLSGRDETTPLPADSYRGVATLSGASFADGSATASIANGVEVPIIPEGAGSTVSVRASVSFDALPFGSEITVASPSSEVQALLTAVPARAQAQTQAERTGASPRTFRPVVSTRTSVSRAHPGAFVSDSLIVSVDGAEDGLEEWGVFESEDVFSPIPITLESSLLGPFNAPIEQAESAPDDAPVVCVVETVVDSVGEYQTPDCELKAVGWYVWVERTLAERTSAAEGEARIVPWRSDFGDPQETTEIVPLIVQPEVPRELARTGETLPVRGLAAAAVAVLAGTALVLAGRRRRRRT